MDDLVSVKWLEEHLTDPDIVVLDCTNYAELDHHKQAYKTVSGHKNWATGHIPGSQHADFTSGLSNKNLEYRNALPPFEQFAAGMRKNCKTISPLIVLKKRLFIVAAVSLLPRLLSLWTNLALPMSLFICPAFRNGYKIQICR